MNLYEITADFKEAIKEYRDEENHTEELFERLEFLKLSLDEKLVGCCAYYKNYLLEAEVFKQEAKRLKAQAEVLEAKAEKFKGYIDNCLGGGGATWKGGVHQIAYRASASVEITDLNIIPTEFLKYKEVVDADKTAIGKMLKENKIVPGAKLITKNNIQIK